MSIMREIFIWETSRYKGEIIAMESNVKINQTFHEQIRDNHKWEKGKSKDYIAYRKKWFENPQKYVVERGPIHLDIETSSICNLRCPMCLCTVELKKGRESKIKQGLMGMERYRKIIDEAAEIGVMSVKLNWRGEPLLNPNIPQMIKYAKEKGIIDIMINTNATMLDEQLMNELIDAGLDKIFFSVDSIDKHEYESIRVGANFEETIDKIKMFCEINERKGHKVYTRVQKVLLNSTEKENDSFVSYFSDIVDQVAFEDYEPYDDLGLGKGVDTQKKIKFTCPMLWQRLLITWDGEYRICCDSYNRGVFGHNDREKIEDFWNGSIMKKIRESHQRGNFYEVDVCRDCFLPYM